MEHNPIETYLIDRFAKSKYDNIRIAGLNFIKQNFNWREQAAAIDNDNHRSAQGKQTAKRELLQKVAVPALLKQRALLQANIAAIDAKEQKLAPSKFDPDTAHLRAEIRSLLRGLPLPEQMKRCGPDADDLTREAAIEAPAWVSGISEDLRRDTLNSWIEARHPGKLADLADQRDEMILLRNASEVMTDTAREIGEFETPHQFEDFITNADVRRDLIEVEAKREVAAQDQPPAPLADAGIRYSFA